ncbi:hypothetical protein FWH58_00660 [Candidatus Saccharibacteria bacterium]|nr:hypothetical protein [Candidatus Saccharibacteria bacterium]
MPDYNGLSFNTNEESQGPRRKMGEDDVRSRLEHIADALTQYDKKGEKPHFISESDQEKITDPTQIWYKMLQAFEAAGGDVNEAFLTLPFTLQQLAAVMPDCYIDGVEKYESGLLVPKAAGKLAVMITGNYGNFKESPNSAGLYLTNESWSEQVGLYPELIKAIRANAPKGVTSFDHMTVGHTAMRDLQRPDGAPRTNYSTTKDWQGQRHIELDKTRPPDWFPLSCAYNGASDFDDGSLEEYKANSKYGVRVQGGLENPES